MSSVSSLNSLLSSSTSTSSSAIDLSSLLTAATGSTSTGIDVTAAVAAAVYAAQAPERQWQTEQTTAKSQITALTAIQTSLATLSTDVDDLNNITGSLAARTVSSSNTSAVTATATAGATVGSHAIVVNSLASTASWYSPSLASSAATLGNTQLNIVANGITTSFTTGSGVNTLAQLASSINSSGLGVTASVVNDSSGSRLALVSTSSGAANDFTVNYAATSVASWSSASVAGASTALSASSFQINDGNQTSTVNVTAGNTLSDVASQINSSGLNVTASVVTDSSGAHLSIASSVGSSVSVTGDPAFSLARASQGRDASLTVDGIPVTSASNTVTGVVSGLTLNLLGTTAGSQATLSVAADSTQISSGISQFVTDYNSTLALVNAQFTYSATSSSQGVLSGDATLRSLQSALMGMVGYTGASSTAASAGTTTPNSLASLGITMGDDGSLTLDTSTLNQAISSNAASVQNFFQGTALNGFAQSFSTSLKTYTSASSGAIPSEINNLNQTYTDLQSQVDDYETGYIASQRTVLTAMYSQAEIALQSLPTTLKQIQAELTTNSGS